MRKNEAKWVELEQRWKINVQSEGIRFSFASSKENSQPDNIKGKIEAENKADKWLEQKLIGENCRVSVLLDKYYDNIKMSTSKAHYRQYDSYIRLYAKPQIGTKRISRLTKADLQGVINTAFYENHLSEKSLTNIRGFLMSFLKFCRDTKATTLYVEGLTIPKGAKRAKKEILQPEELKILFTSTKTKYRGKVIDDFFIYAYRFAVLTGLRPGETLGLENSNIKGRKVIIIQSLNDEQEFSQGKNANARRTFSLNELSLSVIRDQREMLKKVGCISNYVFPDKDMDYLVQCNYRNAWKRYCAFNGITHATTPYELRHTFVSINSEMPEALKKMVIGHSKTMDTEGTYGHQKKGDLEKASEYTENAFLEVLGG